jgi:hypothetical protein
MTDRRPDPQHPESFPYTTHLDVRFGPLELAPRQGFVVPKGVVYRTRAPERAVILMVEGAGIVPTGDWG